MVGGGGILVRHFAMASSFVTRDGIEYRALLWYIESRSLFMAVRSFLCWRVLQIRSRASSPIVRAATPEPAPMPILVVVGNEGLESGVTG